MKNISRYPSLFFLAIFHRASKKASFWPNFDPKNENFSRNLIFLKTTPKIHNISKKELMPIKFGHLVAKKLFLYILDCKIYVYILYILYLDLGREYERFGGVQNVRNSRFYICVLL